MCGIAGIYSFNKKALQSEVQMMADAMSHRGPDASGYFVKGNIGLGHRRLSILDLSSSANQPFSDAERRYQLVFNGELYNFRDVRLKITDHQFVTTGDTEVLYEAYKRSGIDSLQHFKGMFAFAIWDDKEQKLVLARDRLGVKPLYYYADDNTFLFASEIRSILASGLVKRRLNREAVGDYLQYQSVSSPVSIIEGIQQLEAGCYMIVQNGKVEIKSYWDITDIRPGLIVENTNIQDHIYELLLRSVEQRMVSDVPIGAFLSGGIDSSAVVALMTEVSTSRPKTFVVGFNEKEYDESDYALMVAKKFNTDHQQILLSPNVMLDELTNALNAMDTPSGDGINAYIVSREIRNAGITVALSGIGGDELFAGYPFFKKYEQLKKRNDLWKLTSGLRSLSVFLTSKPKLRSLFNTSSADIDEIYPVLRQVFSAEEIALFTNIRVKQGGRIAQKLRDKASAIGRFPVLSQVSIAEYMGYTQQTLLKDTDQMSMAVSLEVRDPFFDHELIEYILAVPDLLKHPDYPKKLLVQSMRGLLPDEIVHRKKQGFVFPWNNWLRNELRGFCSEHILRIAQRDFINGKAVTKLWNDFLAGNKRWMDVWLFVVLEYWLERNNIE